MSADDEMGGALDGLEGIQRGALEDAHGAVRDALAALKPFEVHEKRVLPGIAQAVTDVRLALGLSATHLRRIVAAHLDHVDEPLDDSIRQTVDTAHQARVLGIVTSAPAGEPRDAGIPGDLTRSMSWTRPSGGSAWPETTEP